MIEWLIDNWLRIVVPLVIFLAVFVVGLWLRSVVDKAFERWKAKTKWQGSRPVIATVRRFFLFWFLLLGVAIAVQSSALTLDAKSITTKAIGSLFVLSLGWAIIVLSERLLKMHLPRMKVHKPTTILSINVVRIAIIVVVALILLDIWGIHTTPVLLLIAVIVLAAALALRNAAPNLFAGLQLGASHQIKIGDYIKLATGEEGHVTEISWNTTRLKALDESIIVIPNSRLLQQTVINYGQPVKKAREPFRFYSRTHLTELTGLKARNLTEFVNILKTAPDSVVYYHTHHSFETHQHLIPELSNDFAVWVSDALADEVLGERLASVDIFSFPDLGTLKERFINTIDEYLSKTPGLREAMEGREFHFMKSVSVIFPTPYIIHDLREFLEALRKISLGSLFSHMFESRLRLGRGLNDFSIWLEESIGETELSKELARLDPYVYTLEGLKSALIQLTEKRIK